MPAPDITYRQIDARPALGHVWALLISQWTLSLITNISNLMVDTFIANASADEYVYTAFLPRPLFTLLR